jgi:hypothetical protein
VTKGSAEGLGWEILALSMLSVPRISFVNRRMNGRMYRPVRNYERLMKDAMKILNAVWLIIVGILPRREPLTNNHSV